MNRTAIRHTMSALAAVALSAFATSPVSAQFFPTKGAAITSAALMGHEGVDGSATRKDPAVQPRTKLDHQFQARDAIIRNMRQ